MQARSARPGQGGESGGERLFAIRARGLLRPPAIVEMPARRAVRSGTFAPILYVMRYESFDEVIASHNAAPQACPRRSSPPTCARRSCSFCCGLRCGIVNVNIAPRRGDAAPFGGEKEPAAARKRLGRLAHYMRRATNTINYSASSRSPRASTSRCVTGRKPKMTDFPIDRFARNSRASDARRRHRAHLFRRARRHPGLRARIARMREHLSAHRPIPAAPLQVRSKRTR
jgi:hypothetical protein